MDNNNFYTISFSLDDDSNSSLRSMADRYGCTVESLIIYFIKFMCFEENRRNGN